MAAPGGAPLFKVARADYVGVFGTGAIEANPQIGDGTFFQDRLIRFADIRDGLSNTPLVGEAHQRRGCPNRLPSLGHSLRQRTGVAAPMTAGGTRSRPP